MTEPEPVVHGIYLPTGLTVAEVRRLLAGLAGDDRIVQPAHLVILDVASVRIEDAATDVDGDPVATVAIPGGDPVATVAPSGRAALARLVDALPPGDPRSDRKLAEDLAAAANIRPATARRYLSAMRAGAAA